MYNIYLELAEEDRAEYRWLNKTIKEWQILLRQYKQDSELRYMIHIIIYKLTKLQEECVCRGKLYQSIGSRLSDKWKIEEAEDARKCPQDSGGLMTLQTALEEVNCG